MNVVRNSPEILIIEDRPWRRSFAVAGVLVALLAIMVVFMVADEIPAGLMALGFAVVTGWVLVRFLRRVQIIFDRADRTVTLQSRDWTRQRQIVHSLDHLCHAELEHSGPNARAVLVIGSGMSEGAHPLTRYFSAPHYQSGAVQQINLWLSQTVDSHAPEA